LKKLAIIGSGDLGKLIAYHVQQSGIFEIAGFLNDYEPARTEINGIPVLGKISDAGELHREEHFDCLISAIGYNHFAFRKSVFELLHATIGFATFIHPSAYVDPSVNLGEGCVVLPGCVLDANVSLGNNVLLNTAVTIAHDSKVLAHSFLAPRVAVAGFTEIGECCNIGINATLIDNITVASQTRVGAGAVVTKSITEPGLYVGTPARRIK
jgi:sugar O-acyltransferase (sialic acid O-acetyltransferase NeuD family)